MVGVTVHNVSKITQAYNTLDSGVTYMHLTIEQEGEEVMDLTLFLDAEVDAT